MVDGKPAAYDGCIVACSCSLVVTIKGDNEDVRGYFLCTRSDGTKYRKDYAGNITEGGIGQ